MILRHDILAARLTQGSIRRGGFNPRRVNDGGLVFS
jgi:hypothetical protein